MSSADNIPTAGLTVIRLKPYSYIHVLDNNTNVTRIEIGPQTFTRQEHEKVVTEKVEQMIMVAPRHVCTVANPVMRDEKGKLVSDQFGNVRLRHGDEELRFEQDPFPLYPGEKLSGAVRALQVVPPSSAMRLRAIRDFTEGKQLRRAGDEWLFRGPGTYVPRVEVRAEELIRAIILGPNQALKLRAKRACRDSTGKQRRAGEEWLYREKGAFLPDVDEEIVATLNAHILTEKSCLHLRATRTFTNDAGITRKAGEEWLVLRSETETYIPDVYEVLVADPKIQTLTTRQYCVVVDPYDDATGKQHLGQRVVRKGPMNFFLKPGERLEKGIQQVYVLGDEEALLLRAREEYVEGAERHAPGDRWMVKGPTDYIPPIQVEVLETRKKIPLDRNEGIYVRDIRTGAVRSVMNQSYLLNPYEELWQKDLPQLVEDLLVRENAAGQDAGKRDRSRVVTFRAAHNTAVQVYDYKNKSSRVVFGPEIVTLEPDEDFTVLDLSGGKPKQPHLIKSLALQLGPEFSTDIITVETSDHARLSITLSYNWYFDLPEDAEARQAHGRRLFQVPDFIGDFCKAIAARVRGAVAAVSFDQFHKNSARLIRVAVFGEDENKKVRNRFVFTANQLVITNIDIQSVEPVDQRTRDALQKSVQLAIEITTKSQEATARHEAERLEQEAKGRLERQKLIDESKAEELRKKLIELQANSACVETSGVAIAEARGRAEAARIEGESNVALAQLRADAGSIREAMELELQKSRNELELKYARDLNEAELHKARELSKIESQKFNDIVAAIGPKTIASFAQAGPELQARLLKGLGLKSILITDGNSPVNLFSSAAGLLGDKSGGRPVRPSVTE